MNLHICVVTQQLARIRSGPGVHASNLINYLVRDGHRVSVIAPMSERPKSRAGYEFIGVAGTRLKSHARWIPLALQFGKALVQLINKETPDIIQFTDARESLFCNIAIPIIGHINDTYAADLRPLGEYRKYYTDAFQRWAYYRVVHLLERIALRRIDAVIANSQYTARVIQVSYGLPEQRIHVCYKSIEAQHFAPAIQMRAAQPPHPPRILFIGGNMQRKGLPTLVEAASFILKVFPSAEFWVVGFDPAQSRIEALCKRRGIRHAFRFLGWQTQEKLPAIMAQCDLFTLPSLIEAFGVAMLEAMASGLPVVATRVGGIIEIVHDGENGLLVTPNAPEELANAIVKLLSDPSLYTRLAAAGIATAHKFNVARMMTCTYSIYQKVLHRSASNTI